MMDPGEIEKLLSSRVSKAAFHKISTKRKDGSSMFMDIVSYLEGKKLSLERRTAIIPLIPFIKPIIQIGSENGKVELKKALEERPYLVKGLENLVRSLGKYGLTKPQRFVAPILAVWNFTNACNLRCKHCYQNAGKPLPDELTLKEKFKVIDTLWDAGTCLLALSGGEPTVSPDFFPLVRYASERGFHISVATNGTLMANEDFVKRMIEVGVDYVEISLDSADPKRHDEFRGIPGAWERTVKGIRNAIRLGRDMMEVGVATTVTQMNVNEIEDMIKFVFDELHADRFFAFNFIPVGRGKDMIDMDLMPQQREEVLNIIYKYLLQGHKVFSTSPQLGRTCAMSSGNIFVSSHYSAFKGEAGKTVAQYIGGCGVGRAYMAIQPNGDMSPCVYMSQKELRFGNIRDVDFERVWDTSEILRTVRERDEFEDSCGSCPYRYVCGGCRARAYAYFGDLRAPDPGCIRNREAWDRLKMLVETK